jgi:hypothetical protein
MLAMLASLFPPKKQKEELILHITLDYTHSVLNLFLKIIIYFVMICFIIKEN